jgi:hypothetical protein
MHKRLLPFLCAFLAAQLMFTPNARARRPLKLLFVDKNTQEKRAEAGVYFKDETKPDGVTLIITGHGNYDTYTNIRFVNKSRMEQEGIYRPLESESTLYDRQEKKVGGVRISYEYKEERIRFTRLKEDGAVDFERTYFLKGPTCDAVNLPVCFERFYNFYQNQMASDFYLLSSEPKLYKVKIFNRGAERIELFGEEVAARKVQLMADLGPLTGLAAKFIAPTYFWFTLNSPYRWLKYEGLEKGPDSANIQIMVSETNP